jgi:hypothetical protein
MNAVGDLTEQRIPHGPLICGAKNRRGVPCRRPPTRGAKRCKFQGGLTPVGPVSPHWKHGRYSKIFARIGLGAAYERAFRDPHLGSVREHLAACEARSLRTKLHHPKAMVSDASPFGD